MVKCHTAIFCRLLQKLNLFTICSRLRGSQKTSATFWNSTCVSRWIPHQNIQVFKQGLWVRLYWLQYKKRKQISPSDPEDNEFSISSGEWAFTVQRTGREMLCSCNFYCYFFCYSFWLQILRSETGSLSSKCQIYPRSFHTLMSPWKVVQLFSLSFEFYYSNYLCAFIILNIDLSF